MDALKLIFFSLFTHFAIGTLVPMLLISVKEMGTMFFRLISILAIILLAVAFWAKPFATLTLAMPLAAGPAEGQIVTLLALSIIFLLLTVLLLQRGGKIFALLALLAGLVAIAKVPLTFPNASPAPKWLMAGSFISSALMLGSVLGTMITGHWYLVNHKLTLRPLQITTRVFIGLAILRTLLVFATVFIIAGSSPAPLATTAKGLLDFSMSGMLFWARVGFGLVVPLLFGAMIWSSVKVKNTQSATGILYATIVLVLVGEAFAKYLFLFTGIPV